MMTVGDLIARLQEFDPALPVVVTGFDSSGFDPLGALTVVTIQEVAEKRSHAALYEEPEVFGYPGYKITPNGAPFAALHLEFDE